MCSSLNLSLQATMLYDGLTGENDDYDQWFKKLQPGINPMVGKKSLKTVNSHATPCPYFVNILWKNIIKDSESGQNDLPIVSFWAFIKRDISDNARLLVQISEGLNKALLFPSGDRLDLERLPRSSICVARVLPPHSLGGPPCCVMARILQLITAFYAQGEETTDKKDTVILEIIFHLKWIFWCKMSEKIHASKGKKQQLKTKTKEKMTKTAAAKSTRLPPMATAALWKNSISELVLAIRATPKRLQVNGSKVKWRYKFNTTLLSFLIHHSILLLWIIHLKQMTSIS